MSTIELRKKIKRDIDQIPPKQLVSLADFVSFLSRPSISQRLVNSEKAIASGEGVNCRKVRSNV